MKRNGIREYIAPFSLDFATLPPGYGFSSISENYSQIRPPVE